MIIAGIDVETTGFPEDAEFLKLPEREIVELGYCIYDTSDNKIIAGGFDLFAVKNWDSLADEAQNSHKICRRYTELAGLTPEKFDINRILSYKPEIIVAHNAEFDYTFVTKCWPELINYKWLCTKNDLDHDKFIKSTSMRLMHLAIEYGFPVFNWHRAYTDAEMTCKIAAKHDLVAALNLMNTKKFIIKTTGRYDDILRIKLKDLKFRWIDKIQNPPYGAWIKENLSEQETVSIKQLIKDIRPDWSIDIVQTKRIYQQIDY